MGTPPDLGWSADAIVLQRPSLTTATAYNQGYAEGQSAYAAAVGLGMSVASAPIIYDLEGYNGGTTCRAAAEAFMHGWADYLALSPAQLSGVYGSCNSYVNDSASDGNPPDFIAIAEWGATLGTSDPSTSDLCIPSNHWVNQQRHKQYFGPHIKAPGGTDAINVDSDRSNGPAYAENARLDPESPCL